MSRYERVEAKKKRDSSKEVRKQLDDEIKLELSADIDRRKVETCVEITSDLHESNDFRCYERAKAKKKDEAAKAVR